jgi:hypothetical protein
MTTKKLLGMFIGILAMGSILASCGKDGDIGPAGPAGPQGANGTPGVTGPTGPTGSANVIYSDWLPIPTTAAAALPSRKNFSFTAPALTQDVLDKGLVYAYLKSGGSIIPLPYAHKYIFPTGEVHGSYLTTVLLGVGGISLNQDWLTPGTIPTAFAEANTVQGGFTHLRYVIIPGAVKTAMNPNVNLKDYNEVQKYFNIPL